METTPACVPPSPPTPAPAAASPLGRIPTQPDPSSEQAHGAGEAPQELDVLTLSDGDGEAEAAGEGEAAVGGKGVGAWVGGLVNRVQQVKGRVTTATKNVIETVTHRVEAAKDAGRVTVVTAVTAGKTYVEGTKNVIKDQAHEVMDAGKDLKDRIEQAASGVTHWVEDATAATVNKAGEGVEQAKLRLKMVRGYLAKGWGTEHEDEDEDDDVAEAAADDYAHLLCFEHAAEITIAAGASERLPFMLREGDTVTWEFRVKDYDVGFGLSERVQDFGGAKEEALLAVERIKSGQAVQGSYRSSGDKSVALVWDNTHSIFRPKSVAFIVRVLAPSEADQSPPAAAAAASSSVEAVVGKQQEEETEAVAEEEEEAAAVAQEEEAVPPAVPVEEEAAAVAEEEEEAAPEAAAVEEAAAVAEVEMEAEEEVLVQEEVEEEAAAVGSSSSSGVPPVTLVEEKLQEEAAAVPTPAEEEEQAPAAGDDVVVAKAGVSEPVGMSSVVPIIEEL